MFGRAKHWWGGAKPGRPGRYRPLVEVLEARLVLSTTVATTAQLRAALLAPPPDGVILLQPGTYNTEADAGGTFVVNSSVTLEDAPGGSAANVLVDGNGTDQVFDVKANVSAEFDGLTVQHGVSTSPAGAFPEGSGGGIFAEGGDIVVLRNSVVDSNQADAAGGGIAILGGELSLVNSVVSDNSVTGPARPVPGSGGSSTVGIAGGGIFALNSDVLLDLSSVHDNTFLNGAQGGGGGGIAAFFAPGSAPTPGGGTPGLTLTDSTIDHNSAAVQDGGGILSVGVDLTITRSTVSRNTASVGFGGGIALDTPAVVGGPQAGGDVTITNSTIAGNVSDVLTGPLSGGGDGGGIYDEGAASLSLTNDTVALNSARIDGGGIASFAAQGPTLHNTIVARNTSTTGNPDLAGAFTSQGFNLIGVGDGSTGFTNGVNNDRVGSAASPLDPRFDGNGLQNNGGPSRGTPNDSQPLETIALLPNSPAVDAGDNAVLGLLSGIDERGFARQEDPQIDIGAFELVVPPPVVTTPVVITPPLPVILPLPVQILGPPPHHHHHHHHHHG